MGTINLTLADELHERVHEIGRSIWKRLLLKRIHYRNAHGTLNSLYRLADPWDLASDAERVRFEQTTRLIDKHFGPVGALLEVGSGEGHQTEYLLPICREYTGVEVSERACMRARARLPQARFIAGDAFSSGDLQDYLPVDLAVACEILYYVDAALRWLTQNARGCFVSAYARQFEILRPRIERIPGVTISSIAHEAHEWNFAWWRGAAATQDESGPNRDRPS